MGVVAKEVSNHQDPGPLSGQPCKLAAIDHVESQRLLDKDVLACFQRMPGVFGM
jgi:hypothetical protein